MKKIIALMVALTVIISILNISAFATSDPTAMTSHEFHAAQADLIEKFVNGDITYSEWNERQVAVLDKYLETNKTVGDSAYATAITIGNRFQGISQKISNAVSQWGDGARERVSDWWNSVCNSNNVPTEQTQTSNTDMKGYSSKLIQKGSNSYTVRYIDGYILIDDSGSFSSIYYRNSDTNKPNVMVEFYDYDRNTGTYYLYSGYPKYETSSGAGSYAGNLLYEHISKGVIELYGDVRYGDGSQFPTNDEWEYGSIKKFDEMPERDLEDLLNDFAEEMERQNPDLSTIEGLLNAIYARMGTLDSDNDNDLLASINANILALVNADKDKDEEEDKTNEELVNTLLEIRDSLKNGTLGTAPSSHGHEISGTVYNVIPLDKNFLNKLFHDTANLKVEYERKVYYLEDCGCLKIGDKYYTPNMNYDSYAFADYDLGNENISLDDSEYLGFDAKNPLNLYENLSYTKRKKVDNIVNSIYQMVTYSIPYAAITSAFAPFEVIIFNTAVPEDIVLNFNSTDGVGGFSATILSVSFFQNQYVASAMGIIKPFLMVVIGYCWLKVMRRKVVSM